MLYVSRFVGIASYAVFDTDDNTETFASMDDLYNAVVILGLPIQGVTVDKNFNISVVPYTPENALLQTKLKTLWGIDCTVSNGELLYMDFGNRKGEIRIRLSDICNVVKDNALKFFPKNPQATDGMITLILDDKITLSSRYCFEEVKNYNYVWLDLREVTNENTVKWTYSPFIQLLTADMRIPIIDKPKRYAFYQAVQRLNLRMNHSPNLPKDARSYLESAINMYRKSILELKVDTVEWITDNVHLLTRCSKDTIDDFETFVCTDNGFITGFATDVYYRSNLKVADVIILANYMRYGGKDKDLHHVWLELCNRLL